jgi:peroxiredoxin
MKISRLITASLAVLLSFQAVDAQRIRISGSGKGYSGEELRLFCQSDPVTKSLVPLLRTTCDTTGSFTCEADVKLSEIIIIRTGIYSLSLFIDTISDLELKLPDFEAKTDEDEQNTFFSEIKAVPEVVNDPDNLNNLIRTFDSVYNPVFNNVANRVMYNIGRKEIPGLIEKVNRVSEPGNSEFFSEFIRYRLVMLNQVANGEYMGRKEDSVLINAKFSPGNQAYIDLIEQMFSKYFRYLSDGRLKEPFNHAITSSSAEELREVVILGGKTTNEELAEYVIIMNLFNEYYDSVIPRERIILLLNGLNISGSSAFIRDLAKMISLKLTALNTGNTPPDLKMQDEQGKWITLSGLKGKYVLLSFARSDNAFSVSEYGILNTWISKYRDNIFVVTVLRDRDFTSSARRLHNLGFNWIFLNGSDADIAEYQYGVTMYPSFILIGRDGKISLEPTPFPSENLDGVLTRRIAGEKN